MDQENKLSEEERWGEEEQQGREVTEEVNIHSSWGGAEEISEEEAAKGKRIAKELLKQAISQSHLTHQ